MPGAERARGRPCCPWRRPARWGLTALAAVFGAAAWAGEVTGVTFASSPTGAYTAGQEIRVDVAFDEDVTVTGTPTFALIVGRTQRSMAHDADGSGASTLRFVYEVRAGDLDEDGVSYGANALRGGRIVSGDPATPVDRAVAAIGRASTQRVDAVAPRVDRVRFTSNSGSDLVYRVGDTVEVTVTFDEPVTATGSVTLALDVGSDERVLTLGSSAGAGLVFEYTVAVGDEDTNGVAVAADALSLGATGSIVDAVGNAAEPRLRGLPNGSAHRVDGIAPAASAPRVVSRGGTYRAGDWIEVALPFAEAVAASAGTLTLLVGDRGAAEEREAEFYAAGSGGRQVAFRYRVQPTDMDTDGVSVNANAVQDYTVSDLAGNAWNGAHAAMPEQAAHRVDGAAPTPARVNGTPEVTSTGPYAVGDAIDLRVGFTSLVYRSTDDPPAFTLRVGDGDRSMAYRDGDGTRALEFRYTIAAGDLDADGVGWQANALTGTVADAEGTRADLTVPRVTRLAAHAVDGVAPALRAVDPVRMRSTPAAAGTYGAGETIRVAVAFSEPVEAVHAPGELVLGLQIGTATRRATLAAGGGTAELTFEYTVQDGDGDPDGIEVAGLSGGAVRDLAGNPVADLTGAALAAQDGHLVDGSGPAATAVAIVSDAGTDNTYAAGDRIRVEVTFGEDIRVSGEPELLLTVGSLTRRAGLERTRARLLAFGYEVQPGDIDTDGISIASEALVGGEITDAAGNPVVRTFTRVADAEDHRVDAVPPEVAGVAILSAPGEDGFYAAGDLIEVGVTWGEVVYVLSGAPELLLSIGAESRAAAYAEGSGTQTLLFRYEVQAGDRDDDGISIGPDALVGGVIEDASGTDWEEEGARRIPAVPRQPGHRVFAPLVEVSAVRVTDVLIASAPPTGGGYGLGDHIEVRVVFDAAVHATGDPVLTLSVGGRSRTAALFSGSGTTTLAFRYEVVEDDRDDDGVSVAANALTGGTIEDGDGGPVSREFAALPADPAHRVDGTLRVAGVTRVEFSSAPMAAGAYVPGEAVDVSVVFDAAVYVTGNPVLTLSVGGRSRTAALFSGSGTDTLVFRYEVIEGDRDEDGVSIAANALTGGTIEDGDGRPVSREFAALPADSAHRVDGARVVGVTRVAISSTPAAGVTYVPGEALEVSVVFDAAVYVTGDPVLTLAVGGRSRVAALFAGSGTTTLVFRYEVLEGDRDEDGVSVAANALTGGTLEDGDGRPVSREFAALPADSAHRVDGARVVGVTRVAISSTPAAGVTYVAGEALEVNVVFDAAVYVTGNPVLALAVGGSSRTAALFSGSGTDTLMFRYEVVEGDQDDDGVSVAANGLTGGTIEDGDGRPASREFAALPADAGHRVDGTSRAARVTGVEISSVPMAAGTYLPGEALEVSVVFDAAVYVTGDPVLATVGGSSRTAALFSGSGTDTLVFRYEVAEGDRDEDGVSVAANGLTGGTIEDGDGRPAAREFAALPADAGHRVDGTARVARLTRVAISSEPMAAGTYLPGELIEVSVSFDHDVHVTGAPAVTLSIGASSRAAEFQSGSCTAQLLFRYVVVEDDRDGDGISIGANAMTGGVIEDASGRPVDRSFAALLADAGAPRGRRGCGWREVTRVAISSKPMAGVTYVPGEALEVSVVFDAAVYVTGNPVLALAVGGEFPRRRRLFSGSGTDTLVFRYEVVEGDQDDDGVSIAANALTGGTIEDGDGRPASREFAALPADAGHRVDGTSRVARVTGVEISSAPMAAGTYVPARGDRGDACRSTMTCT